MYERSPGRATRRRTSDWAKLVGGTLLMTCAILFLMKGLTPPGATGDVFRNNMKAGIDATPLFYTEVESLMPDE